MSDNNIDNELEQRYNTLQEDYKNALEAGDHEKIDAIENEIAVFLGDKKPPDDAGAATPVDENGGGNGEVSKEEQQVAKDGDNPPEQQTATEEWLNNLDPEVRKRVEERLIQERKAREYHEQRYQSDIGRLNAYQKKYEDERKTRERLEKQLRDGVTTQPANQPANDGGAQTANATQTKIVALNEKIARIKNSDPELAELLEATRDALVDTEARLLSSVPKVDLSPVEELREKIAAQEQEILIERERARLEAMVPGAIQILDYVDPRSGWSPWQEFVRTLPPSLQQAAGEASADTYAYLMPMYGQWAERYNAAHGYTQQATSNPPPANQPDARATEVQAARQQKLVTSAAASAKSSPPPNRTLSLEERRKNPPEYGTPEYEALMDEIIKATMEGKL